MSMATPVKLWSFPGGIHPPERKTLANTSPIRELPLPPVLYIPLRQHLGSAGEVIVAVGEHVLRGQALTEPGHTGGLPVHAPTSGTVVAIGKHPSNHPSLLPEPSIELKPDGKHQSQPLHPLAEPFERSPLELIQHIQNAGIAGLGGAGFPTAQKLAQSQQIQQLIINGVECEPYIVSDDRLMREHAATIVRGAALIAHILGGPDVVIAIEDNKPEAITAMESALTEAQSLPLASRFILRVVPTKYPSGGEKQLIQVLTGKQVPARGYPANIGIIMQNVATAYAVARAVEQGEPLLERVVTLTGEALAQPGTAWVLLGTPISHVLDCTGLTAEKQQRIIVGGPMMGYTLNDLRVPVIKTTNCILAPRQSELATPGQEMACIRCGACEQVCPAVLLPQQLYWLARAKDHDGLKQHHLTDCIECGACAYVCPSEIPLVQYYRQAKADIREAHIEHQKAEIARQRFEARQARLEREKEERLQRHRQAAEARKQALAARAQEDAAQQSSDGVSQEPSAADDPQKAKVAAAVARAKAKKAAQQQEPSEELKSTATEDPQKAKVAAAVARAKAKKAAQQQASSKEAKPTATEDPQKAKVAAAVARAKAKRAAQLAEQGDSDKS